MTVTVADRWLVTAEDLALPGAPEKFVELVEGELIEMTPAGRDHNWVALNFMILFREFVRTRPGLASGTCNEGFLIEREPDTILSPDACLFRKRPKSKGAWLEFAPEVVLEVLSPSNTPAEMAYKRGKLFSHGTEQFWIADLETKSLHIHHSDGRSLIATAEVVVDGEGIVEGMQIRLEELFELPQE